MRTLWVVLFSTWFCIDVLNAQSTTRVNVSTAGMQANSAISSFGLAEVALSDNSRFVAFRSAANNLVPNDTNGLSDVFVRDTLTNTTERVSVSSAGAQALGGGSSESGIAISADGRWVAFDSRATNLVPGDTNNTNDVFVRDRQLNLTTRVSVRSNGQQGGGVAFQPAMSSDGRFVVFTNSGDLGGPFAFWNVYIHDRLLQKTEFVARVNTVDGFWYGPDLSDDGLFVVFETIVPLVANDTNGLFDVYVWDRQTGGYTRLSVSTSGQQALGSNIRSIMPKISSDGRKVSFLSDALNLVANDDTGGDDVFLRDRSMGQTTRISVSSSGERQLGNGFAQALSANGAFVIWDSTATNLVAGDTNNQADYFVRDLVNGTTRRVNLAPGGLQSLSSNSARALAVSSSGQLSMFTSSADDLVPNDTNGVNDAFLFDATPIAPAAASISTLTVSPNTVTACPGRPIQVAWSSTGFMRCSRPRNPAAGICQTTWGIPRANLPSSGTTNELLCTSPGAGSVQISIACTTASGSTQTRSTTLQITEPTTGCGSNTASPGTLGPATQLSNGALNYFLPVSGIGSGALVAGLLDAPNGDDFVVTPDVNGVNITVFPSATRALSTTQNLGIILGNGVGAAPISVTVVLPPSEPVFSSGFE